MLLLTAALIIALLILANAFYVAAEFAAISIRSTRIQQLAEDGHWLARKLLPLVEDPEALDRYIAASQIGITLASLILGAYGQEQLGPILAPLFERLGGLQAAAAESTAAALILIGLTVAQMILGELVPKSLAMQFPNQAAFFTALPMAWSLRVFRPFIWLLNGSGMLILELLGVAHTHRHVHSPEEIRMLIAESTAGGLLEPEERRQLNRALELSARRARDVMVPAERIVSVDVDAPVEELFRLTTESPYTRLPVRSGSVEKIVGVVHTKDVTLRLMAGRGPTSVRDVMRPVFAVADDVRADRLLITLREHHLQQAVVVRQGQVLGLVSLEDVMAQVFGRLSDELKGAPR